MVPLLTLTLACASSVVPTPPPLEPAPLVHYDDAREALEAQRVALATRLAAGDEAPLSEARTVLLHTMADEIFPAWYGTPWHFYGSTRSPQRGWIACGYFVSTTLQHTGFDVERVLLAQQPSEHIITTLVPPEHISRWRGAEAETVLTEVSAQGDGLYLLGLDYHAAWLVVRGGEVDMCHASYIAPAAVLCEPAAEARAFESHYRVTGALLNDTTLRRWLEGDAFPTDVWEG